MMSRKRFVASPPNIYSRHDSLSSWLLQRLEKVNNKLFCNNTTSFVFCCVSYYSCKLCRCTSKSLRSYLTLKISCFYCCRETEEAKKFVVEAKTIGDKESNNKGKHQVNRMMLISRRNVFLSVDTTSKRVEKPNKFSWLETNWITSDALFGS